MKKVLVKEKVVQGDRKNDEDELRLKNVVFDSAISANSIANIKGNLTDVNSAFLKIWGYCKKNEVIGKSIASFFKDPKEAGNIINALNEDGYWVGDWTAKRKDGSTFIAHTSATDIKDSKGKLIGYQSSITDITLQRTAEDSLRDKTHMLEQAEAMANFGYYSLDIKTGLWTSSKALDSIFSINIKYIRSVKGWAKVVHSEDRKMMLDYFANEVLKKHNKFNKEYRIVGILDKKEKWVHGLGDLEFDKNNKPIRMFGTIHDITENKLASKKIKQAQDDLLTIASHQIRTPLSATKWTLETLTNDKNLTLNQREKLNNLYSSNERLILLINNFLNITKIEAGAVKVDKKIVDIKKIVVDLVKDIAGMAEKSGKVIKIVSVDSQVRISCDPLLISQALINLMSNAIYYASEKSKEVVVKIKKQKSNCLITVHNDGHIDKATADNIRGGNRFFRSPKSSERFPIGSGLGLYITKKVIDLNGGEVWFESETKSGTNFYLKIISD